MIQEFISALETVAALGEQVVALEESLTGQETEVLRKVIEKILPVMRYVGYRIEIGYYHSGQQFHIARSAYLDERGIVLVDKFDREYTDRDTRGDYVGSQLVLTCSGKLLQLARNGCWSCWQGESSFWEAKVSEITTAKAVAKYGFAEIVKGIATVFKEAVERNENKRRELIKRTEILYQVREILK